MPAGCVCCTVFAADCTEAHLVGTDHIKLLTATSPSQRESKPVQCGDPTTPTEQSLFYFRANLTTLEAHYNHLLVALRQPLEFVAATESAGRIICSHAGGYAQRSWVHAKSTMQVHITSLPLIRMPIPCLD